MSGIHISDICIGDIAKLKHGRGFMRIDEIDGNEIRERSESNNCAWCDYTLVEAVGRWQERKKVTMDKNELPFSDDLETYTVAQKNSDRPWCSAQPLEFLTVTNTGNLLAEPPIPVAAYIILQNWYEQEVLSYGHKKRVRTNHMKQPMVGFGPKKAIICKDKDAANRMMNFLTEHFCYQAPELIED